MVNKVNSLALINGPISKTTFLKGKYSGITEYIAFKTGSINEVMLIFNKQLSVSPITTHIPINKDKKIIKCFQLHYLPNNVSGKIDKKTYDISHFLTH